MSSYNPGSFSHNKPRRVKFNVPATAEALKLDVVGKNIHCLHPDKHYGGFDQNPSCRLNEDYFYCFSCGSSGDAIDMVQLVLGYSFSEAWDYLSMRVPCDALTPVNQVTRFDKELAANGHQVFTRLFELASMPTLENLGGRYLSNRKLNPELCGSLGVRYLEDPSKAWAILCSEFSLDDLEVAGIVNNAGTFHFEEHPLLFFFLHNNTPVYLAGRSMQANPKIKELKPVGLSCPVPYLIDVLLTKPTALYICEGLIDTLSAAQLGISAIGAPGANSFPENWLELIPKTTRIHVLFDRDPTGENSAIKLQKLFRSYFFRADALVVPIGKDVNDFLIKKVL
jgi:DNA primase